MGSFKGIPATSSACVLLPAGLGLSRSDIRHPCRVAVVRAPGNGAYQAAIKDTQNGFTQDRSGKPLKR